MSKFKFIPSEGGRLTTLFHEDRFIHAFYVDDLADLATAAQAALAEQNSGVMGGTCACNGRDYYIVNNRTPACNEFEPTVTYPDVCYCGHDEACHQPQAQRREA